MLQQQFSEDAVLQELISTEDIADSLFKLFKVEPTLRLLKQVSIAWSRLARHSISHRKETARDKLSSLVGQPLKYLGKRTEAKAVAEAKMEAFEKELAIKALELLRCHREGVPSLLGLCVTQLALSPFDKVTNEGLRRYIDKLRQWAGKKRRTKTLVLGPLRSGERSGLVRHDLTRAPDDKILLAATWLWSKEGANWYAEDVASWLYSEEGADWAAMDDGDDGFEDVANWLYSKEGADWAAMDVANWLCSADVVDWQVKNVANWLCSATGADLAANWFRSAECEDANSAANWLYSEEGANWLVEDVANWLYSAGANWYAEEGADSVADLAANWLYMMEKSEGGKWEAKEVASWLHSKGNGEVKDVVSWLLGVVSYEDVASWLLSAEGANWEVEEAASWLHSAEGADWEVEEAASWLHSAEGANWEVKEAASWQVAQGCKPEQVATWLYSNEGRWRHPKQNAANVADWLFNKCGWEAAAVSAWFNSCMEGDVVALLQKRGKMSLNELYRHFKKQNALVAETADWLRSRDIPYSVSYAQERSSTLGRWYWDTIGGWGQPITPAVSRLEAELAKMMATLQDCKNDPSHLELHGFWSSGRGSYMDPHYTRAFMDLYYLIGSLEEQINTEKAKACLPGKSDKEQFIKIVCGVVRVDEHKVVWLKDETLVRYGRAQRPGSVRAISEVSSEGPQPDGHGAVAAEQVKSEQESTAVKVEQQGGGTPLANDQAGSSQSILEQALTASDEAEQLREALLSVEEPPHDSLEFRHLMKCEQKELGHDVSESESECMSE